MPTALTRNLFGGAMSLLWGVPGTGDRHCAICGITLPVQDQFAICLPCAFKGGLAVPSPPRTGAG